jgi:hypothetical protein
MSGFIAGTYTATWNNKALGQTADGFRLSHSFFKRLVTGDLGAQTPQDAIYQGREQFCAFRLIEAALAGAEELAEPYAFNSSELRLGTIGVLDQQGSTASGSPTPFAKSLVLTAVAGTPAASGGPATITFANAILAEGFPVEVLFAPDLREIPIRMRCYPDMTTGLFASMT